MWRQDGDLWWAFSTKTQSEKEKIEMITDSINAARK
jgi:hypothetical protein